MPTATRAPAVRYVRPWLAPYQLDALFCDARYAVCEATTKSGKTVGAMAWLAEQAWVHGRPGRHYWWIAPIYAQARIAFQRMTRGMTAGSFAVHETRMAITLPTGAIISFKGAENPDSLYGEDVYAAVIDEASRVKEDAWFAVRSTLTATEGPVRVIGNVKGRQNWAYRLARKAESGEPGMHYAKITAHDAVLAAVLNADEVEDARRMLPDAVFRELYLAEPSDDGGNPFGLGAIAACVGPLSPDVPVAFGVDLAKSVDWTVCIGLDRQNRVCRLDRFQKPWEETVTTLRRMTSGLSTLVDSTGVGDPILETLQRSGGRFEGFKFSSATKQQLMEGLALAIQRREVTFPDGPIRAELEAFEYEYTRTGVRYSAPEGMHDDCVCALALAVKQGGHRVSVSFI